MPNISKFYDFNIKFPPFFLNPRIDTVSKLFNPLPDMPILGSLNSTGNKDVMSKIWTNGDTVI